MSGACAFTVLMFLRLVVVCRLTYCYPLISFLSVIIAMKEVADQHGPWWGIRILRIC